ncbi:MAG: 4-(cytidine 5'-diphospho)-2-C-methyl-D-erythritol kinase [Dokdonella sp.]
MAAKPENETSGTTNGWTVWPAPAKLNLFLHIVGRRADGYHELQTVFQILDRGDLIGLRSRADGVIARTGVVAGVAFESDLAIRAAQCLRGATGSVLGADIDIRKFLPIGAGLGGGSSDAATVLVGLNAMWNTGLSSEELAQLGLALGADVPVFVQGHTAFAEGIGERLQEITLPEHWYFVVDPGIGVPTRELFQSPELTRAMPTTTIHGSLADIERGYNAFEPVVRERYPEVARIFDWLERVRFESDFLDLDGSPQSGRPHLSGSGGSVFVMIASETVGRKLAEQCPAGARAVVARGVAKSPLIEALECWQNDPKRIGADTEITFGASPSW